MDILLAEDEPHIAQLVSFKLEQQGFRVTWVDNGQKAVDVARTSSFSLILLDVMMPVLDGYQTLEKLRQEPTLNKIPIIMLTAKGQEEDVTKAFQLGATDYLVKPFDAEQLIERVKRILEESK